jgi:pyridinium-3,5-biscarboxylic acid mononucleotide synthase
MNEKQLTELLQQVRDGKLDVEQAVAGLRHWPFADLGDAVIDTQRELRSGYPEVIYCAGKSIAQIEKIIGFMLQSNSTILATRADEAMYKAVAKLSASARYNPLARTIVIQGRNPPPLTDSYIAIVTAGTSDLPVAEEAAETALVFGNRVERISDVGVAGLHRLFAKLEVIRSAKVIIVAAGMEGALVSVISGLVDKPVIALPTSIGYGASFNGLAALLGMLNSCAAGVSVVNIDNGFGAGYLASMINKL